MKEVPYNRKASVDYARRWALARNPMYFDFENLGGDCTNFASQCIYAGSQIMNYTHNFGWYYKSSSDRTPSWTGVEFLYNFLINNKSVGPFATEVSLEQVEPGDIVQLGGFDGRFYHSPIITAVSPAILVCAHTFDALDRPLLSYNFAFHRFLHIEGIRVW